jgi:subtilisin family serine protease
MSTSRKATSTALILAGLLLGTVGEAAAETSPSDPTSPSEQSFAPGELVVRYRPGASGADRADLQTELGADVESASLVKGVEVLDLPAGATVEDAVEAAESQPQVLYAEPNYTYTSTASPNDPMFGDMWSLGLSNSQGVNSGIGTPRVWSFMTGSPDVTVAVVDTGIDASHPDLAPNMWTNTGEVGANGVDDDKNGLVDDSRGWDYVSNDSDPNDENGHGTHVAGIIGAQGNNGVGVAGVSWDVNLMPLRVLDAAGSGWTNDVADAFAYAGRMGVKVVNASLAGPAFSQAVLDAIAASPNTLFVVAAGNSSANVGTTPSYPCNYPLPNVMCVAATGTSNQLSSYSNYGSAAVDLAAPGDQILSTWPGATYNLGSGTSSASPHVAGVAALLSGRHPEAGMAAVRTAILVGSEKLDSLAGRTVSGGRLSAAGAFEQMGDTVPQIQPEERLRQDPDNSNPTKKRCRSSRRHQSKRARRACRAARSR